MITNVYLHLWHMLAKLLISLWIQLCALALNSPLCKQLKHWDLTSEKMHFQTYTRQV